MVGWVGLVSLRGGVGFYKFAGGCVVGGIWYDGGMETIEGPRFVQVRNPRTGYYAKIDREKGKIMDVSLNRYKGVPDARRKRRSTQNEKR